DRDSGKRSRHLCRYASVISRDGSRRQGELPGVRPLLSEHPPRLEFQSSLDHTGRGHYASPRMGFESLGLSEAVLEAVTESGYENPTPIQAQAIPLILEGRDVIGASQTGTGKTAAFALPTLSRSEE